MLGLMALCSSGLHANDINGYTQLQEYVTQCIANLFYPEHNNSTIRQLQRDITRKIDSNYNLGFFYSYYDQSKVYDAIIDESINYVCDLAYKLKGERARTMIRKEIIDRISRMREIPIGFLLEYTGRALQDKLAYVTNYDTPTQPQTTLYPSSECCICFDEFDGTVEQVFLYPCGHDVCKSCCRQHFFEHYNKTCPKCRANVNINKLRDVIFGLGSPMHQGYNW